MTETKELRRAEVKDIIRRHQGAQAEVVRRTGLTRATVIGWLKGRTTSAHVKRVATEVALELLDKERKEN